MAASSQGRIRRRAREGLTAVVFAGALVASIGAASTAGAVPVAVPKQATCEAFSDYFQAAFFVQIATAFATEEDAAEDLRNMLVLVLSPKLERLTTDLARDSDPTLRKLYKVQADAFAKGVDLLEGAGLTRRQVKTLSELPVGSDFDTQELLGDVDVKKAALERAAKEFGKTRKKIDLGGATPKQQAAFGSMGVDCGVFPDPDLDCETLLTRTESAAVLGAEPEVDNDQGTCEYTVDGTGADDDTTLGVEVYRSELAYQRIAASVDGEAVSGIGDDAVVVAGFNTFSHIETCGRTMVVASAGKTIVVAACIRGSDDEPSDDVLIGLVSHVLPRA